jgi:RNA polymerase sigma-70 factor (ECF subfamily)
MDPDPDILAAARAGDERATTALVERYARPVHSLCFRMLGNAADAEDAAQESFVRAFQGLGRYDEARPFATWLLSIASHHCIDRLRRRRLSEVSLDALPPWRWRAGHIEDPEDVAGRVLEAERIQHLLMRLPDDYRLVIVLRYWHDLGYGEIAHVLGETESAVKSRLHRARRILARALETGPASGSRHILDTRHGEVRWTAARASA